jgi:activator of 2-hydroxyglutaryl-CoA dehydratase
VLHRTTGSGTTHRQDNRRHAVIDDSPTPGPQLNPEVDTIIEIGGQDAKFTTLKDGRVTFSNMNNVCAAGTGSFIEEQAARLGCPVRDYSRRAEAVRAPLASDRCTVFMERDINHYLSEGYSVDEVLASALHAVRENYLLKVATEKNIG